jgi:hypothetical protein
MRESKADCACAETWPNGRAQSREKWSEKRNEKRSQEVRELTHEASQDEALAWFAGGVVVVAVIGAIVGVIVLAPRVDAADRRACPATYANESHAMDLHADLAAFAQQPAWQETGGQSLAACQR